MADEFDVHLNSCGGQGCADTGCTGGYNQVLLHTRGYDLAVKVHEEPQLHVTALHSQRISFDFETAIVRDLVTEPNGFCWPRKTGQPTFQTTIVDRRYEQVGDQIKDRVRLGKADVEILILVHRNNLTGLFTTFEKDVRILLGVGVKITPSLQQFQDRINAEAQASQRPQRSRSLEERRSKICKKRAVRRR